MIEIVCTAVICVTVLLALGIFMFGSYLLKRGPLQAWKAASMEGFIYDHTFGKMMVATPRGRLAAGRCEVEKTDMADTDEVAITMTGLFRKDDLELYI